MSQEFLNGIYFRASLALVVALTLVMGVIGARPYDDHQLPAYLPARSACQPMCLMDIQLGVTTGKETLALLAQSDWVKPGSIHTDYDPFSTQNWIYWEWSGRQPAFMDDYGFATYITRHGSRIDLLGIHTNIPLGEILLMLGLPKEMRISRFQRIGSYPTQSLFVANKMRCQDYWKDASVLYFTAPGYYTELAGDFRLDDYAVMEQHWRDLCRTGRD